ncbi:MAG: hypothetical protein ACOC33_02065 [bacterium]
MYTLEDLKENIKEVQHQMIFNETGEVIDLLDWNKARDDMITMIATESDMTEGDFWDKYDKDSLEVAFGDNTYNWGYLAPDWNISQYNVDKKSYVLLEPHMGGDIRGNYGNGYVFDVDDGFDIDSVMSILKSAFISIGIQFKDKSSVILDAESIMDMPNYTISEVYNHDNIIKEYKQLVINFDNIDEPYEDDIKKKEETYADAFVRIFDSFNNSYDSDCFVDEFLD